MRGLRSRPPGAQAACLPEMRALGRARRGEGGPLPILQEETLVRG